VTRARVVLGLHAGLATLAAGVLGLTLFVAAQAVSLRPPSAAALATACTRFALPDVSIVSVAALAFGSLAIAVVLRSAVSLARQLRDTRRFLAALPVTGSGPRGSVLIAADTPQAFCAGLLRPRIYISHVTLKALRADELDAVLAHEAHHVRLRDPLRIALARSVSDGLFFLPAARRLADRYTALAELAADGSAVRAHGAQPLASALLAFERADPAVVGMAPERFEHLLGDPSPWQLPLALIAWAMAVLAAVAAIALRLHAADGAAMFNLPLVAAQSCMLLMAVLPVVLGASMILAGRRIGRRGRLGVT
jgi:Zn-dependent protease with chaperone function